MNVAFLIGKNSVAVCNTLKRTADNIDFYSYKTVKELVKESNSRHIFFSRIILSSVVCKDIKKDLHDLNEFIKNYSDSTEVVFIVKPNENTGHDEIFSNIFNAPMYTPVFVGKVTTSLLLGLVQDDILELKTKYYVLNEEKDKKITSSSKEDKEETNTVEEKKPTYDIRGGKKNSPAEPINKPEESIEKEPETISETQEENLPTEEPDYDDLDDLLSIGDFGSKHSDTGFLDEDDEEEILKELSQEANTPKAEESPKQEELPKPVINTKPIEESIPKAPEKIVSEPKVSTKTVITPSKKRNIGLVTGLKGSGVTQSIVNEAVKIHNKRNIDVLIIDMDFESNGILSFIDVDSFYKQKKYNGITEHKVYTEDGVGVISNGYSNPAPTEVLLDLLKDDKLLSKYSLIFIDCPIQNIGYIPDELLKSMRILVRTGNDRSDLIATSIALTDRSVLSLEAERYIMNTCNIEVKDNMVIAQEDLAFINNVCLFANGNWLLRYGNN